MALILNIETATETCSVCLSQNGAILAERNSPDSYDHTASLTLLIKSCMAIADRSLSQLDAVALSSGPGSYTALRVGTSVAKGICFALDKPLIAVNTLQALALASRNVADGDWLYCPMIDARRMEVYTAVFNSNNECLMPPQAMILDQDSFQAYFREDHTLVFSGNGAQKCQDLFPNSNAIFRNMLNKASLLPPLAHLAFEEKRFENLAYYAPLYIKPPNITTPKKVL